MKPSALYKRKERGRRHNLQVGYHLAAASGIQRKVSVPDDKEGRTSSEGASRIPDEIRLKAPRMVLKLAAECKQYTYPLKTILNTDFSTMFEKPDKIFIALYRVNHCRNRANVMLPFLEYLLYKYPSSKKSTSNLLIFPFLEGKAGGVLKRASTFLKNLTGHASKAEGFIERGRDVYLFYNASAELNYTVDKIKLKTEGSELWWCLIDEICNHRKVIYFPVHPFVYTLFYKNPALIYLYGPDMSIDIPIAAYWGNYYKFIPMVAAFGQQATAVIPRLGAHYYYGSFRKAVRYAGWTPFYTQQSYYDKPISDQDGKYTQGGLIRFALFMGRTKVIVDQPDDNIRDYLNHKKDWLANYQSVYIGRVPYQKRVYSVNPEYVTKNYSQQVPLSIHRLDMASLKSNWDPLYAGYRIT